MSHSLNEIAAHAKRAARGAGLSWGMAEEAARATRWLAAHDLAGPALLCDVLARNDGLPHAQVAPVSLIGDWHARGGALCPLAAGATLNDCADRLADGRPVRMLSVSCPLLVVPFVAWAAIHLKAPVRVTYDNVRIDTDGDSIRIDDPHRQINVAKAATVTCQRTDAPIGTTQRPGLRGSVTPDIWARLDVFAQRTFAPATEASRLLGAGAGLSDND
ncbi:DUF3726 domain-containing protein [uncultured Roseobacter sp.]|uniref:DUF3726 domain-containing protein n=1 Tax=uncultured Roseobacter sp. TaxID=114847 RepID=UPI002627B595|nr:DUF3726 domain-containing protein [uncultured Roseobacter sp.]